MIFLTNQFIDYFGLVGVSKAYFLTSFLHLLCMAALCIHHLRSREGADVNSKNRYFAES